VRVRDVGQRAERGLSALFELGEGGERVGEVVEHSLAVGLVGERRGDVLELVALGAQLVVRGRELLLLVLELDRLVLELGGLAVELVAVLLQRVAHRVERAGETRELVAPPDGDARAEVAGSEAIGRGGDPAHRRRDGAAEVRGEREHQRDARDEHDHADGHRARGRVVGGGAAGVGERLLGRVEAGELGADRVDAALALRGGRRVLPAADGVDERDRVLVDVAPDPGRDLLGERLLRRVVGDERGQALRPARERRARRPPRREEPLLAREGEAARAGLEVEQLLLREVRGREHLRRVARHPRRVAHVGDRDEHPADRQADDHRQRRPEHHHPCGEARADVHRSASGPSTSRTFSRSWMGEKGFVM
jgi:hypothetical protein